ncbi:CCA tRNA nucleotidyltransferase [Lapidilactobacillus gannanensis]|jgi:tRNA nucleotidyltransferase (CCA-adding enzyme)|uniref:CCA-adding enzyme n=1 Tax=Lapidilactobacillus gannanensis TaxID=2486002 RepID=A0ABW4BR49_9LACO|nr:CCA tRNA nucleotidyltransferase [Lapidilactobacillus gannanensis]MCH4057385.1 CCA tRNA nucleotidyltransferase [Lactobacillaceae bacterium]
MYLKEFPLEFEQALPILQQITTNGYEAYFVGGSVRDHLLGKAIADVDIASSAFPAEIKTIFPTTIDTGIKHGTVTVRWHQRNYEVTTFRTESGYQDFRRPDHVTFVRSLLKDLQRRDFTINALAVRADGLVIDEFTGLADLQAHLIRAVGNGDERFHEDALRMMRAVRFSSQLDFRIEAATFASLIKMAPLLEKIAVERIHSEFVKMMLSPHWQQGWSQFVSSGLIQHTPFFKNRSAARPGFAQQDAQALPDETSVWLLLALAMNLTYQQTQQLLRQWKTANQVQQDTLAAWNFSQLLKQNRTLTASELYQADPKMLQRLTAVGANLAWQTDFRQLTAAYQQLPIKNDHELALNGGDLIQQLGLKPGPQLGQLLAAVKTAVLTGVVENQKSDLIHWSRKRLRDMI